MDEPFGALDEITREALNEELLQIWRSAEILLSTIVLATHSINEAVQMSDRIFILAPRPARLVGAVHIPVSRPSTPEEPELVRISAHVRKLVRNITCDI
jgi:NitT/TauT family transport system ATP-binding protein